MLANVDGDLLALLLVSVHQYPLNEVVAILVTSNVDEWNSRSVRVRSRDDSEISIEKFNTANLEAFLDDLRGVLIDAVAVGVDEDVIDDSPLVRGCAVLAEMLNTPIAELTMSYEIDVGNDLFNSRSFFILNAVLEDVLNDQTSSLAQRDFVPHATKGFVDLGHNLRWLCTPS